MNLSELLIIIEEKYLRLLEDYFNDTWGDTKLWSHDLSHHRRVWNYAKEILLYTDDQDVMEQKGFCDKLIIACYLHDLGMAVDTGLNHGHLGRELCQKFIQQNNYDISDFQDVLFAIENHDDKNYTLQDNNNKLLLILNAADDLDAIGYTGILRYADIYLKRGTTLEDIGKMVLENAGKRFENFETTFHKYPALIEKHRKRYLVISEFYTAYNRQ
ncbi:MAG: HD domain-containing protein [Bacteroidia bacterium]|nr:HD domain-containing protein [Bacteroidia bacterium]